jgi:hypothetical protein
MSAIRWFVLLIGCILLAGCGLSVPEIQENRARPIDGVLMVQAIIQSVRCQMIDAFKEIDKEDRARTVRVAQFLDHWGVEMTLTLTLEEKSTLAPNLIWMPPSPASAVFTLGAGGGGTADATRTDKMSFYYLIPALRQEQPCTSGVQQGNETSLLVENDLKLNEWLRAYLSTIGTQQGTAPTTADGVLKDTVLTHDIKFDITSTGNITPAWKLTRVSINPSGTFFSTSRDRTHDMSIVLGPGDKTGFTGSASFIASQSQQIAHAITTGVKGALSP